MPRVLQALSCTLLLFLCDLALASDKSCAVGGITGRWAMSYCMNRFETDDDAHPDVHKCYMKELQQKLSKGPDEDCDANLAYKAAICAILVEYKLYEESLASCVDSDGMTPTVVTDGIG